MGCWGIIAADSDAGLDAIGFIRRKLQNDGKASLGEIIEALQQEKVRLPDIEDSETHTSPMALAEIVAAFMDGDISELDYDEEWAKDDNKFKDLTSFTASKDAVQWLRDYIADTLQNQREQAVFKEMYGTKWGGWFEEKNWIGWQEHMEKLISHLDTLLTSPGNFIELISQQEQKSGLGIKNFNVLEQVCASTPDRHHFLIMHAQNSQTGDTVWAIGDDQVCAITREDFIRNKDIEYNDVLIQEFPYETSTPESVGDWRPLIEELVCFTMQKHLQHDGLVHVYPQWLPEDVAMPIERKQFLEGADHVILYDNFFMEVVPKSQSPAMESHSL